MDGRASSFERVFDARDLYKSASVSPFLGLPTHHRDGLMQNTHRHVSFSLSLCSPSRSITTITAERHVRRRRLGHRPVEKDEKSVQKVLLPWRRPRTTPRIENRQIGRPVLRAPKTSIPQRSRPQTVGAGEEAPQSEERGSRDGQARNDQNALEKHDHSAGDDWRHRRRV